MDELGVITRSNAVVDPIDMTHLQRFSDVRGRSLLTGVACRSESARSGGREIRRELPGRIAPFSAAQTEPQDRARPRLDQLKELQRRGGPTVPMRTDKQGALNAPGAARICDRLEDSIELVAKRDVCIQERLGPKHHFGPYDSLMSCSIQVGQGQV